MRVRPALAVAGLAAALIMSIAVTSASANRLSISNTRFKVTWSALVFTDEGGAGRVTCPVTIEGSFHSATVRKVRNALVGYVTRGGFATSGCSGGSATILSETLPWHVTYDSFTGTLPNITGVSFALLNEAIRANVVGFDCDYRGDATHFGKAVVALTGGGTATSVSTDPTIRILKSAGSIFCPAEAGDSGTGQVFLQGNTSRIVVTLI